MTSIYRKRLETMKKETLEPIMSNHDKSDTFSFQTLSNPGTIVKLDDDNNASVSYPSGKR